VPTQERGRPCRRPEPLPAQRLHPRGQEAPGRGQTPGRRDQGAPRPQSRRARDGRRADGGAGDVLGITVPPTSCGATRTTLRTPARKSSWSTASTVARSIRSGHARWDSVMGVKRPRRLRSRRRSRPRRGRSCGSLSTRCSRRWVGLRRRLVAGVTSSSSCAAVCLHPLTAYDVRCALPRRAARRRGASHGRGPPGARALRRAGRDRKELRGCWATSDPPAEADDGLSRTSPAARSAGEGND
jgi:hypothetical protein